MSTPRIRITEILSIIGDAIAAASAVEAGRQPKARTLRGLGIDPKQFRDIRYRASDRKAESGFRSIPMLYQNLDRPLCVP